MRERARQEAQASLGPRCTPTAVLPVNPNPWLEPDLLLEHSAKSLGPSMLAENLHIGMVGAHLHSCWEPAAAGGRQQDSVFEGCCLWGEWQSLTGAVWPSQTLMIRDWWMCMIISVMFEFLEYGLEHQLPNFSECWWDHVGAAGKAQPGWARACRLRPYG